MGLSYGKEIEKVRSGFPSFPVPFHTWIEPFLCRPNSICCIYALLAMPYKFSALSMAKS